MRKVNADDKRQAAELIELNGDDLRRDPRKVTLASVLTKAAPGLRLNKHIEADGPTVFAHACKIGLEGGRVETEGPLFRLAQGQERGVRGGAAGGGGRPGPSLTQRAAAFTYTIAVPLAFWATGQVLAAPFHLCRKNDQPTPDHVMVAGAQIDRRADEVNLVPQRREEPNAQSQASFDWNEGENAR